MINPDETVSTAGRIVGGAPEPMKTSQDVLNVRFCEGATNQSES